MVNGTKLYKWIVRLEVKETDDWSSMISIAWWRTRRRTRSRSSWMMMTMSLWRTWVTMMMRRRGCKGVIVLQLVLGSTWRGRMTIDDRKVLMERRVTSAVELLLFFSLSWKFLFESLIKDNKNVSQNSAKNLWLQTYMFPWFEIAFPLLELRIMFIFQLL